MNPKIVRFPGDFEQPKGESLKTLTLHFLIEIIGVFALGFGLGIIATLKAVGG